MSEKPHALIVDLASQAGLNPTAYWATIKATVLPPNCKNEQAFAFLMVAREYRLNPVMREIYAFPTSNGGIQPIVGVDGWLRIAESHPQMDGLETDEVKDEAGKVVAVTCKIYRKDRSRPVIATEYMAECARNTTPWKQWPIRMLTNKAISQAIRRAFSVGGLMDIDEAERWYEAEAVDAEGIQAVTASRLEEVKEKLAPPSAETEAADDGLPF